MGTKLGRRDILALLCGGAIGGLIGMSLPMKSIFNKMLYHSKREKKFDYQLPTKLEIDKTNIARLVLDLEYSFGQNGAINSMQNRENYLVAKEKLETLMDIGDLKVSENASDIEVRSVLNKINNGINLNMHKFSENPHYGSQNYFCDFMLQMKYDCDTYSVLVLGIANKYNLPINGVLIPNHIFTRWNSRNASINFDQGVLYEDDSIYISGNYTLNRLGRAIPPASLNGNSIYLKSLSKAEFIANHATIIARGLCDNNESLAALELIDSLKEFSFKNPLIHCVRGEILRNLGYFNEAMIEEKIALRMDSDIFK